jgi:hypothetical protein
MSNKSNINIYVCVREKKSMLLLLLFEKNLYKAHNLGICSDVLHVTFMLLFVFFGKKHGFLLLFCYFHVTSMLLRIKWAFDIMTSCKLENMKTQQKDYI